MHSNEFGHQCEDLLIVDTFMLGETFDNETCFVTFKSVIESVLKFENPFAVNRSLSERKRNKSPGFIFY